MIDKTEDKLVELSKHVDKVLEGLGIYDNYSKDLTDEHLRETPLRIVKAWKEYTESFDDELRVKTFDNPGYDELIICKDIPFHSLCLHHFFPFEGICHVAYLPDKKIVGLSKIPRIIKHFSKRPQFQEKLVNDIADYLMQVLEPKGVMVIMRGSHTCMVCRGVESNGGMTTSALRGQFKEDDMLRSEGLTLLIEK